MREQYETPQDRENEKAVAKIVGEQIGLRFFKIPISYRADYFLDRNGVAYGWAEVKVRNNLPFAYPTYMISFEKFVALRHWATESKTKALLFVQFSDKTIYWANLLHVDWTLAMGGRTKDPRDWQDIEPVVYIPMLDFYTLAEFSR